MGRIVVALVLLWLGTAHATPCVQPELEPGITRGQLTYQPQPTFEAGEVRQLKTPTSVRLAIAANNESDWFAIEGEFDPATKYVGLDINGYTMLTTPDQLYVCSRGSWLYDRVYDATIFTIDRYGNRSDAVSRPVKVIGAEPEHHIRCGMYGFVMVVGSLFTAGILLGVLIVAGAIRKSSRPLMSGVVVAPLLAENIARTIVRGYWIKLAIAVLTTAGLWTFDHPYLAFQLSPFAVVWFFEVLSAWHVARQCETKIAYAGRHGKWLVVNGRKLFVPRRVWEKTSSIPTAGLA